jgi:hypothetical protein
VARAVREKKKKKKKKKKKSVKQGLNANSSP